MAATLRHHRVSLLVLAAALTLAAGLLARLAAPVDAGTVPLDPVVSTPLGDDVLLLAGFSGTEQLSQLFSYEMELVSADSSITAADLLGGTVALSITDDAGGRRTFTGLVSRFAYLGAAADGTSRYWLEVVPDLWLLTQASDNRIFAEMSVPEVVAAVLSEFGITEVDYRVTQPHPTRECVVQYRETDFNFVSRLMEEEGIFYFFEHHEGGHTLVLADGNDASRPLPGDVVPFDAAGASDTISEWIRRGELTPGRYTHTDYDFTRPQTDLLTSTDAVFSPADPEVFELYDYPGGYTDRNDGERLTRLRMEAEEAIHDVADGGSTAKTFTPGGLFTIRQHPRPDQNRSYLLTGTTHRIAASESGDLTYHNSFSAIPTEVPYRPPRHTPIPVVQGPQTAMVVGSAGEEIYPDEHGRVKVVFHWDREGTRDDTSSCWIRVSQLHAGQGWGGMTIPRIGSEVIVDFLEGDPDRPIIVGRVYNADDIPNRRQWR